MDDRHPKRRLDVKLYALFDRFELDDLSFLNEQERHLDQTELSEAPCAGESGHSGRRCL